MSEPLTNRGTITLATYCAKTQVYTKIFLANALLLNVKCQTETSNCDELENIQMYYSAIIFLFSVTCGKKV